MAYEHPDEARRQERRQCRPAEIELFDQHRAEHAGQKDVEDVEEGADTGDDGGFAVRASRRQPVEARADRAGRRDHGPGDSTVAPAPVGTGVVSSER